MMRLTIAFAFAASLIGLPAVAQERQCEEREKVTAFLAERYQEHPVAAGIERRGELLTIYATADGKTWTLIATSPAGMSCYVASGEYWRVTKPIVEGVGS